jgi:TrmH family RNA methyltransferase
MALSQRRTRIVGRLRSRKTRERERLVLVEGVRASEEALAAGAAIAFAVVAPGLASTGPGADLLHRLRACDVVEVGDAELAELSDTRAPQGVLLVCEEPTGGLDTLSGRRFLVLDGIQDPGNAGSLVRGAVAFALDGVVCLDGTVDPWGAKTVRASAGLIFRAAIWRASAGDCLRRLGQLDVPLLVADASGGDAETRRGMARWALAVGNEGAGVRGALRDAAAAVVSVPMKGPAESLNAGVAGSILMHILSSGVAND